MKIMSFPVYLLLLSVVIGCTEEEPTPRHPLTLEESDSHTTDTDATTDPDKTTETKQRPQETDDSAQDASEQEVSVKKVKQKLDEATEAVAAYSQKKTDEALARARKRLDEFEQETAALKNEMGQLQQGAQEKLQQSVDQLERRLEDAQQQLGEVPDAGAEAWTEAADDLQASMDHLKSAYDEATSQFKEAMTDRGKDSSEESESGQE